MRTSTSTILSAVLAAIVIAGIPAGAQQQTPVNARGHLENARALLETLPSNGFSTDKGDNDDAADEVAKLKRQFDELVKTYDASPDASTETGWKLKFSEVERTLARIIGGGTSVGPVRAGAEVVVQSAPRQNTPVPPTGAVEVPAGTVPTPASNPASTPPTAPVPNAPPPAGGTVVTTPQAGTTPTDATPAAVGTSGVTQTGSGAVGTTGTATSAATGDAVSAAAAKVSTIGIKRLNPDVRRQLETFRTEVELFYVAPAAERTTDPRSPAAPPQ